MIGRFVMGVAAAAAVSGGSAYAEPAIRPVPVAGHMPLGSKPGNPTYDMPAGQRLISPFGERPVFSPDGRKIAFIAKSYGDAMEYDLRTGKIRNLTSHMAHAGFLRVHYLSDGSYVLLGPHIPEKTVAETRQKAIELFWLDAKASRPPVPLRITVFEGVASSVTANRIAWAEISPPGARWDKAVSTTLKTADVQVGDGGARLENIRSVATFSDCLVEAQDFLPGDTAVTLPCYDFRKPRDPSGTPGTEVISIDLTTKAITRYPTPQTLYGEIEGIFPDGRRTLVECSGNREAGMDMCVLELKTENPAYTRLTHIMDYGRWKYGNPVVRRDGRMIAAQVGPAGVEAGVGAGIVVIDLPRGF